MEGPYGQSVISSLEVELSRPKGAMEIRMVVVELVEESQSSTSQVVSIATMQMQVVAERGLGVMWNQGAPVLFIWKANYPLSKTCELTTRDSNPW